MNNLETAKVFAWHMISCSFLYTFYMVIVLCIPSAYEVVRKAQGSRDEIAEYETTVMRRLIGR